MAKFVAAVVTDIHYGFDIKDKLGSKAPKLVDHFLKAVDKIKPAFIVDMGDRVSAKSKEDDRHYMKELKKQFNKAAAPVYSLMGNHDVRFLSRKENEDIMGCSAQNHSLDKGNYHFVFWNPTYNVSENGIEFSKSDLEWLKKDLDKAQGKPSILFSHVPLDNLGGEEVSDVTKYFFWTHGKKVRKVMEDAGNVILCMSGHRHRNRHREINGIHYVTQQSLVSMWKEHYRIPSRSYSFLELDNDKIKIELKGKTEKTYELTPKAVIS